MRLTLQQIEDLFLHSEKDKPIPEVVWLLLYFTARHDGIESLDALRVIRREPEETGIFIAHFLTPGDVEEVKKLSFMLGLEMRTPHSREAVSKRLLDAWVAKMLMLNIAKPPDRKQSQVDDSW